jgi:hypothetical protein
MRLAFIRELAMGSLVALGLVAVPGRADSPLPPPMRQTVWSSNRRFFAVTDPKDQTTTVYRATPDGKAVRSWAMYGYLRFAWLADDGDHLVADPDGWAGLVPLDYDKGHPILYYFLRRGELVNKATLGQIIGDLSKLRRTASHYHWGSSVGFDEGGRFVIETVEGRTIRFDVSKGEPIIETPPKRPR